MDDRLNSARFPRASQYHPDWVLASLSSGSNALWMTEWLAEALELRPGMRVLDLGCGRAMSSIFLHREFGVQVWAVDLWFDPAENLRRIRDAGVEDGVFPLRADARALPFAAEFFDAIVAMDSFMYFGTDVMYLNYLARYIKPGCPVGIAQAGMLQAIDGAVPDHLRQWWEHDQVWSLHSADWWRQHWARTGIVTVETADSLADGWRYWVDWLQMAAPGNTMEIRALQADAGRHIGYVRVVGRRRPEAIVYEPVASIPLHYEKKPLVRD